MGPPMMGFALENDQIPVVKATNCALITSTTMLSESNSEYADQPTLPCIRCGKCMDVCPVKLLPQQMYWHIRAKDFEKSLDHNINDCIDCGCCSYVCPSHIPLVDYFRFAKNEIAQHKSDLSRDRHEFLLFRKERDKRERDEKRAAHKAALLKKKAEAEKNGETSKDANKDSKAEAIKAAMARAKAKKLERSKKDSESKANDEI